MDNNLKTNNEDDESMNFDDNYNEQDFIKQQIANNQNEKLTIMSGFNELCQKLNYLNEQQKEKQNETQNFLTKYYAQCKEKSSYPIDMISKEVQKLKISENNITIPKLNKPSPMQGQQNIKYSSQNGPLTPTVNRPQSYQTTHERNPSQGENIKKPLQQIDLNDTKRNYSSVQDKKKLLQPSKNISRQNNVLAMKDYFGEDNGFVNKKVHGKNFINKEPKTPKNEPQQNKMPIKKSEMNRNMQTMKLNNENSSKDSNMIATMKRIDTGIGKKEKNTEKEEKPRIILYKKVIDLSQSTESILEAFKTEQMKSDYEIFSESQSTIQEGLFAKAIVQQRATKTVQSAQSPNYNYLHPSSKETQPQKQYISSPINISYSPNPTNNYKSIFQKREIYR